MKTPNQAAAEAIEQVVSGRDFATARGLLKTINADLATKIPDGCPYSIATNVAHADFWQQLWLKRLRGETLPKVDYEKDFPVIDPKEWPKVRKSFCDGLEEALAIAKADPFAHGASTDEKAIETLLKVSNHGAYHIGQIALMKRILTGR